MPVNQPPLTGDAILDSFNREVADAINTMQVGATVNNTTIVGGGTILVPTSTVNGVNTAFLRIYQRVSIDDVNGLTPPPRIQTQLRYNYEDVTLRSEDVDGHFTTEGPWDAGEHRVVRSDSMTVDQLFDGWTFEIPARDPVRRNDYIYVQQLNVAERDNFEDIGPGEWSPVQLEVTAGIGNLRAVTSYEVVAADDQEAFEVTIQRLYLGEREVTGQIPGDQICWLIAESDGTFAVDTADNPLNTGNLFMSQAELDTALAMDMYTDRNFFQTSQGPIDNGAGMGAVAFGPRHAGYTTTFNADELFDDNARTMGTSATDFSQTSREIEPRITIANVVNI